jgi:hypothetical protein
MRERYALRFCVGLLIPGLVATTDFLHAAPPAGCVPQPNSNIGCEFYAVSMPNLIPNQSTVHFGVATLNPGAASVDVTVTGGGLAAPNVFSVAAGSSVTTQLPWVPTISGSLLTAKIPAGAYHITVTGPVSALQLNAVEASSQSSDASLLLPVQSAGTAYRAVVWPAWNPGIGYPGNIVVVATAATTTVQVAAPGTIQPGAGLNASGGSVSLDQGDVLLISSALAEGSDLSGTLITSDHPVLVWTGHAGAEIPFDTGFADHLEETLPPLSALDNDYFIVRPGAATGTDTGSKYYVKLVGVVDGTLLTTDPAVGGLPASLDAGHAYTFEATTNFHLQASQPVAVAMFMEGGMASGFSDGDPSQSIPVPTHQGRSSIDFIAPTSLAPIYAQLVAPTGAAISVDATPVSGWTAIGSSGYSETRVALSGTDGHHASGDKLFSLSVHAYPGAGSTSYWYPGSLGIGDDIFRNGFE